MEKWLMGIDLGGTTTKLAFIDQDGRILHKWEIATDISEKGSFITTNIANAIDAKLMELNEPKSRIAGIGMGAPGPVNQQTGTIYEAINLGWHDYPLKELLETATSLPVAVDNDANMAALGEMWKGAGAGARDLVCVTLGTGVGSGIIHNGTVVQGASGAAGEVGHIAVVTEGGDPCNCGKHGCLETVASATGIVRLAVKALKDPASKGSSMLQKRMDAGELLTSKLVFQCAGAGDPLAKSVADRVMWYLGLALSHIGNVLNPDKIVIGGGVSHAGNILLEGVRDSFEGFAFKRVKKSTEISLATLGNDAGVIGAAWLIKNRL